MVFVYIRIYFAARARARRAQANKIKRRQSYNSKQQQQQQSGAGKEADQGKTTTGKKTGASSSGTVIAADDSVAGLVNGKPVIKVVVPIMEEEDEDEEGEQEQMLLTKTSTGGQQLEMQVRRISLSDDTTHILNPTVGRRIDATVSVSLDHLTAKSDVSYWPSPPTRYTMTAPGSLNSITNEITTAASCNKLASALTSPHGHCITFRDESPPLIGHKVVTFTPTTTCVGSNGTNEVHHFAPQQQQMRVTVNSVANNNSPELAE